MAQWGKQGNNAANSVLWGTMSVNKTPNTTNQTNLFQNVSSGAFTAANGSKPFNMEIGQFGITTVAKNSANTSSENKHVVHTGWALRRAGTGGIASVAISNNGLTFANGETIVFSNGTVNATATAVTNSTGGMTSTVLGQLKGAGWAQAAEVAAAFTRETHIANVTVTGTATGYNNTDVIVMSNGSINATATFSTNSIGGALSNASFTITNVGLFPNTFANNQVVVTVANSSGGASAGSGATFTVKVTTSTNGGVTPTLGGRAGRVTYETLIAASSLVGAGTTQLPNT